MDILSLVLAKKMIQDLQFKTINGEDILGEGNIQINGGGDCNQSDWNQNDPNADNYIHNRTHYAEVADKEIYSNNEIVFDDNLYLENNLQAMLIEGETYTVTWQGKTYICVAYNDGWDDICIGNQNIAKDVDEWQFDNVIESNEPFFIATYEPDWSVIMTTQEGICSLSIVHNNAETIHYLDAKYIKDMYYTDEKRTELKTLIDDEYCDLTFSSSHQFNTSCFLEKDKKYDVYVNGNKYECVAWYYQDWDAIILGNAMYLNGEPGGDNVPFAIDNYDDGNIYFNSDNGTYYVTIEGNVSVVHQIDEKYIPDTIARITDIPEFPDIPEQVQANWAQSNETAIDYIKNKPFGDNSDGTVTKIDNKYLPDTIIPNTLILNSSTEGSTKKFKITVDDSGTISAVEVQ